MNNKTPPRCSLHNCGHSQGNNREIIPTFFALPVHFSYNYPKSTLWFHEFWKNPRKIPALFAGIRPHHTPEKSDCWWWRKKYRRANRSDIFV